MRISYEAGHRVEEILLFVMILLDVLGFLGKLPGDVEYVDKLIAFIALAILFYKMSPTRILFGIDNNLFDFLIILAYSFLVSKNLVAYATDAISKTNLVQWFYYFLYANSELIVRLTFLVGGVLLILIAFYFSIRFKIMSPCMCDIFLQSYEQKSLKLILKRLGIVFLLLTSFFIIVFNLVMEWLGIIADDAITMMAFIYLIVIVAKHKEKLSIESWLFRVGEIAEKAYNGLIEMFQSKDRILFGVTAMLMLHLLTDVSVFLIPYAWSFSPIKYFGELGAGHEPILYLMVSDLLQASTQIDWTAVLWAYAGNVICVFFLFLLPAYVWYHVYTKKPFSPNAAVVSLFYSSLSAFILVPIFSFQRFHEVFVGVDILTHSIENLGMISIALITGLVLFAVVFTICHLDLFLERILFAIGVLLTQIFFTFYMLSYFISAATYYITSIISLMRMNNLFTTFYLSVFFCITFVFYTGGTLFFIYETWKKGKSLLV